MALIELAIPPGVYKNGTEYQSAGRWRDANLVRWFEGTMRPVGGWRRIRGGTPRGDLQVIGKARGSHAWRDNEGNLNWAIGTHSHLFLYQGALLFDITPSGLTVGKPDSVQAVGYGTGPYGFDTYGVARTTTTILEPATVWQLDNFGQILLGVSDADGRLIEWTNNPGSPAAFVTATAGTLPVDNSGLVVTEERFCMLLGAGGDGRRVAWSEREDYKNWQITATTQAGDYMLSTSGLIQLAKRVRGQLLILTTTDAHVATYLGPPFVYGFQRVGTGCGAISKHACVVADDIAAWMGQASFFLYDGFVKPLPCEVGDFVFRDMNTAQTAKVFGVRNAAFGEIWWYYPSAESTECDRYVIWSYRENTWSVGTVARTTAVDREVYLLPMAVDPDGYLYEHEVGFQYDDGTIPFAESGPIELLGGGRTLMLRELIPDELNAGDVQVRFASRWYPNATRFTHGPYSMSSPTSVRLSGRQVAIRIEGVKASDWRIGKFRFDAVPVGKR